MTAHRQVMSDWFAQARRDLMNLPLTITDEIEPRDTTRAAPTTTSPDRRPHFWSWSGCPKSNSAPLALLGRIRVLADADASQTRTKLTLNWCPCATSRTYSPTMAGWSKTQYTEGRGYDLEARRANKPPAHRDRAFSIAPPVTESVYDRRGHHRHPTPARLLALCRRPMRRRSRQVLRRYEGPATLTAHRHDTGSAIFRVPGSLKSAPGTNL